MEFLWYYLVVVNAVAFCMYGIDKRKAIKKRWRIPEATLLGIAFVGGSAGAWVGMRMFRHKTQHLKFMILVPVFFVLQVAGFVYLSLN